MGFYKKRDVDVGKIIIASLEEEDINLPGDVNIMVCLSLTNFSFDMYHLKLH